MEERVDVIETNAVLRSSFEKVSDDLTALHKRVQEAIKDVSKRREAVEKCALELLGMISNQLNGLWLVVAEPRSFGKI